MSRGGRNSGINKQRRFFAVRDKSDVDQGNISQILLNTVDNVTDSGREVMIISVTEQSLKTACYEFYNIDPETDEPVYKGRTLAEIRTYPNITIEET